jgi:uncharacterized protein (TIGR00251 family)
MTQSNRTFQLHGGQMGAAIAVRLAPRASKNEISEVMEDGAVKIRLTAPPVDGQANAALIEFLSGVLGVPKSKIEIVGGLTSRDKLVTILGMDADTVQKKIMGAAVKKPASG